jgi:hypothetical protein
MGWVFTVSSSGSASFRHLSLTHLRVLSLRYCLHHLFSPHHRYMESDVDTSCYRYIAKSACASSLKHMSDMDLR